MARAGTLLEVPTHLHCLLTEEPNGKNKVFLIIIIAYIVGNFLTFLTAQQHWSERRGKVLKQK